LRREGRIVKSGRRELEPGSFALTSGTRSVAVESFQVSDAI